MMCGIIISGGDCTECQNCSDLKSNQWLNCCEPLFVLLEFGSFLPKMRSAGAAAFLHEAVQEVLSQFVNYFKIKQDRNCNLYK